MWSAPCVHYATHLFQLILFVPSFGQVFWWAIEQSNTGRSTQVEFCRNRRMKQCRCVQRCIDLCLSRVAIVSVLSAQGYVCVVVTIPVELSALNCVCLVMVAITVGSGQVSVLHYLMVTVICVLSAQGHVCLQVTLMSVC